MNLVTDPPDMLFRIGVSSKRIFIIIFDSSNPQ